MTWPQKMIHMKTRSPWQIGKPYVSPSSFASVHDAVDDLATEDDPNEDQIPLADWEELFNGQHSAED